MLKTIRDMLAGSMLTFAAAFGLHAALAVTGTPPQGSFALQDGVWLNGVANGVNFSFVNGLTAAGTNRATALQLSGTVMLQEVDTTASSTGVALPQCLASSLIFLGNTGANTLSVYGNATVNPVTAANDTINGTAGSTAYTLSSNTNAIFWCSKNGQWLAGKVS